MWNYKESCSQKDIDEIAFQLLQLKKLDEVLELTVYRSNLKSSSKDFCLLVTFFNEDDLNSYLKHPDHLQVVKLIEKCFCKRECFDVEVIS
jgi:hypothetical protein